MKTKDIVGMALHNLWSRKLRSILNLIGVVIGCTMLFLTFAGTRGASNGIKSIISRSEDVRKMMIHRTYDEDVTVPEELLVVEGEMSDERRERIRESSRNEWLNLNARNANGLTDDLPSLNDVPHVQEIFAFSFFDSFLIFLVASMICTIASLLPAYRAARLDPVVAMRRS